MIKEKVGKVKDHIERHKAVYISVGVSGLIAGITCLIVRGTIAQREMGGSGAQRELANIASLNFKPHQVINITSVIDNGGRGHPGWPVRNIETGTIYPSIRSAAEAINTSPGMMAGHIHGKYDDVHGLHFERINLLPS